MQVYMHDVCVCLAVLLLLLQHTHKNENAMKDARIQDAIATNLLVEDERLDSLSCGIINSTA